MDQLNNDDSKPTPKQILLGRLRQLGIPFQVHQTLEFRTMDDCRRDRGDINGVFCKNLFVRDKKKHFFLISALEDSHVDLKTLRKDLEAYRCLTFATAEEMEQKIGVQPGGVTPFALLNCQNADDVTFVLDSRLLALTDPNNNVFDSISVDSNYSSSDSENNEAGSPCPSPSPALSTSDLANFHPLDLMSTLTIAVGDLVTFVKDCGFQPVVYEFQKQNQQVEKQEKSEEGNE